MASYDDALAKMFEERLKNFYTKYDPSKLASVPALLSKYKGNEEKLIRAMVQKYGPEPEPEELQEDDDDAEEEEEEDETTASAKEPASATKDAIGEDEEEEDAIGRRDDQRLAYCDACGLPPEYCEYAENYEKCVPWLKKHCPQYLKDESSEGGGGDKKKKSKRGGGVIKKKEIAEEKQKLVIYTEVRSRKKTVTVVEGLETVGVKLKDASKLFGRKFACSSSVKEKDTGGNEIVVQGDIIYDLPGLLVSEYGIARAKMYTKDGGKLVPLP
ncbi:hypothetical protein CTAYLR_009708 [Chrysophaeum taylorii]|uniref:SUI1 domain-containing protein n=1 Tax=Chrysophaeum taylorii TaxID=2483200 RepID=A0AAD7XME4_9STRA|nr:hypothetical protein CTAYLR_009708 [Chrysophaeum taylorii]